MRTSSFLFLASLPLAVPAFAADRQVSFSKEIQPIFEKNCWQCHGTSVQLSSLSLIDKAGALKGGEHGSDLVPGSPEKSRLYRMVSGQEKPAMPMGGKLTAGEIESIRLWIEQGAVWDGAMPAAPVAALSIKDPPLPPEARNYWAFRKPVRLPVPAGRNPIDAFLERSMQSKGIQPAPAASRRALVRRAYLDLLGLPPTPAEIAEFLNDKSPNAWPRLLDRLLASPHYGERWGRHWLDIARYADSNGFEHDFDRPNAWRYRDYVIRALNNDIRYDDFLRQQIAGDELDTVTQDSLIATGFLRNYAKVGFREKDNPENRYDYLDDMIATIGRGVLGLTVQCARCHDHKFDPIRQTDYYRLQASLFGYVEVDHPLTSKQEAEAYSRKVTEVDARISALRQKLRSVEQSYRDQLLPAKYKKFPQNVQAAIDVPEAQRTPGQTLLANQVLRAVSVSSGEIDRIMKPEDLTEKQRITAQIAQLEKERPTPIPLAAGITDGDYRFTPDGPGDEPAPGKGIKREAIEGSFLHQGPGRYQAPPSYFLIRGDVNSRGPRMQPGFLKVVTPDNAPSEMPLPSGHTSGRRRALAEWLVSPDNPLTARVIVNRIWHHHFGRGIVPTLDNFGKMGELPSHPELLDWLAVEFMDRGWSLKQTHRLIMNSQAYQRSSEFEHEANLVQDPDDKLLWRYPMKRLEAEIIRDSILAASGGLNPELFGRPVFPVLQPEVLESMKYGVWKQKTDGPEVWRRSIYVYRKRGLPLPIFEIFDLPDQNISCGARNVSTVPTQALALMNDQFVLRQAELFAGRLQEVASTDPQKQIDLAYEIALARPPDATERRFATEFLKEHKLVDLAHVMFNLNEFLYQR
ncbi:MAG TPA: PSD1 and planctomycete cytochrome C domain-containing protein [Bryobacteraceae bacterium]|nr:PSD1 and planctomycete cytochrome C domain-containing protein [Bryobacteraceae bacterium]